MSRSTAEGFHGSKALRHGASIMGEKGGNYVADQHRVPVVLSQRKSDWAIM